MCGQVLGGSVEVADGVATLALYGEADLASRADFDRLIDQLVGTDADRLVVDLQRLTFLESACLRSLLHAHEGAAGSGRSFAVRNATGIVRRVLEIAGVAEVLLEDPGRAD
jgi:anti-anti-sigma factor